MHIARIRHLFYPYTPRDYFFELSRRQVQNGHRVDVLTWKKERGEPDIELIDGFTIRRLEGINFQVGSSILDYPYLPRLSEHIRALGGDIIHAESHLFLTSLQAIRAANRLRIPSVVTVHGVRADRGILTNSLQYAYLATLASLAFDKATRVVCLTRSDAEEVVRFGCPPAKIRIIPNAVDTELFKPGAEPLENLVLWHGRFVPEKGLRFLIRAAKIVSKDFKDVKFLLVGYGPGRSEIEVLCRRLGLGRDTVELVGPFDRMRISELLAKATLFAMPSTKEGLPLALLEAMSCGKAVVCSNIGAVRGTIEHQSNGLLVEPGNPEELASAISMVLNDVSLRKRLGSNARKTAKAKFSWETTIAMLDELYIEAQTDFAR